MEVQGGTVLKQYILGNKIRAYVWGQSQHQRRNKEELLEHTYDDEAWGKQVYFQSKCSLISNHFRNWARQVVPARLQVTNSEPVLTAVVSVNFKNKKKKPLSLKNKYHVTLFNDSSTADLSGRKRGETATSPKWAIDYPDRWMSVWQKMLWFLPPRHTKSVHLNRWNSR